MVRLSAGAPGRCRHVSHGGPLEGVGGFCLWHLVCCVDQITDHEPPSRPLTCDPDPTVHQTLSNVRQHDALSDIALLLVCVCAKDNPALVQVYSPENVHYRS